MKCFKSNLLETGTYYYYDEKFEDFMRIHFSDMHITTEQGPIPFNRIIYKDKLNRYHNITNIGILGFLKDSSNFVEFATNAGVSWGYGSYRSINPVKIDVVFNLDGICRNNHETITITGKSIEELKNNKFFTDERWCVINYVSKNNTVEDLKRQLTIVSPSNFEEGAEYFSIEYGKITITELNNEIDDEKKDIPFIIFENSADEKVSIKYEDVFRNPIYYLPFDNIKSPLNEINKGIKEQLLSPAVQFKDDKYIVFWNKIDTAANYCVKIYRKIDNYLYDLGDFMIERSKRFFTIDNLIGTGYIFKVYAEGRNGEIISMSRGITAESNWPGRPRFMEV